MTGNKPQVESLPNGGRVVMQQYGAATFVVHTFSPKGRLVRASHFASEREASREVYRRLFDHFD